MAELNASLPESLLPAAERRRAWLRYARLLTFEELMNYLSGVRLGMSLNLLPGLRVYTLNKLMIFTQPAHLDQAAGRDLSPEERDAHRATFVRRILATEGEIMSDDASDDDLDSPEQA